MVKKLLKSLGWTVGGLVMLILVYLLSAWLLARIPIDGESDPEKKVAIYILTNGVHTDFVLPAKDSIIDWTSEIRYDNTVAGDTSKRFLAMGWGDKGFYLETPTWAELKASVAFKAATGLSTTAIHATYHDAMLTGDSCRRILISNRQYRKLIHYIRSSFQQDASGHFINIKTNANYGDSDAFYEAKGSYSMFHTCNGWVNNGLKAAGLKSCFWTPFDTGLFLLYPKQPG